MQTYQKNIIVASSFVVLLAITGYLSVPTKQNTLITQETPIIVKAQVGNTIVTEEKIGNLSVITSNNVKPQKSIVIIEETRHIRPIRKIRDVRPVNKQEKQLANDIEKALSSEKIRDIDKRTNTIESALSS